MTRRVEVLWGFGDYAGPHDSRTVARWRFLDAMAREVPDVLDSLRQVNESDEGKRWRLLVKWGERWRLTDSWILQVADATLTRWDHHPSTRSQWAKPGFSMPCPTWPDAPQGWDPTRETQRQYEARIQRYVQATVKAARTGGLIQATKSRISQRQSVDHRFRQLARWHVGGKPLAADAMTLRKALHATARLIDLTIENPRGRPRKQLETGKHR